LNKQQKKDELFLRDSSLPLKFKDRT